jgi:hypothetical protein
MKGWDMVDAREVPAGGLREAFVDAQKRLPLREQFCDNCAAWTPAHLPRRGDCSEHGRMFHAGNWCGEWR